MQTLRQLVHAKEGLCYVREGSIEDWPSVPFRGPASSDNIRWKMNLAHFNFQWPPADPNTERRKSTLQKLQETKKQIAEIKKEMDKEENLLDLIKNTIDLVNIFAIQKKIKLHYNFSEKAYLSEVDGVRVDDSHEVLRMYSDSIDDLRRIAEKIVGGHYHLRQSNLEDVFLKTTGRRLSEIQ